MKVATIISPDLLDERFTVRRYFVGRHQELSDLSKAFQAGKQSVQIRGDPGMGKTALALMFTVQNKNMFPGGVFETHAYGAESVEHLLTRTISSAPKHPALLLIDNADSLDKQDLHRLRRRLKEMPQLRVILTTRRKLPKVSDDENVVSLGPLTEKEVRQLLRAHLSGVAPENARRLYELLQGSPALTDFAGVSLREKITTWNDLFQKLHEFEYPGIVGPDGRPLKKESAQQKKIIVDVTETNEALLRILKSDPSMMRTLSPRKFEEIIAELLTKQGYDVTITPVSRDGGFDMYAAKKEGLGRFLYLVECKRYIPPHNVGVDVVRALYGVLQNRKATAGVIVTSSLFTKGAREFSKENFYQLQLHDYIGIQDWLNKYV